MTVCYMWRYADMLIGGIKIGTKMGTKMGIEMGTKMGTKRGPQNAPPPGSLLGPKVALEGGWGRPLPRGGGAKTLLFAVKRLGGGSVCLQL